MVYTRTVLMPSFLNLWGWTVRWVLGDDVAGLTQQCLACKRWGRRWDQQHLMNHRVGSQRLECRNALNQQRKLGKGKY